MAIIVVLRIITQFGSQTIGLRYLGITRKRESFPWKMYLFPLPAVMSLLIWIYVFITAKPVYIFGALMVVVCGAVIYYGKVTAPAKRLTSE